MWRSAIQSTELTRLISSCSALTVCALWCGIAAADEPNEALTYVAPQGCGTDTQFLMEVRTHIPRFNVEELAALDRVVETQVFLTESGASGFWILREAGEHRDERRFEGTDCASVSAALALSLAIGLESILPPPRPAAPKKSKWKLGVRAGVQLERLMRDVTPFGVQAALQAKKESPSAWDFFSEWRLGVEAADGGLADRSATFGWVGGSAGGCWVSYRFCPAFRAAACAEVFGGAIRGRGERVNAPRDVVRSWVSASSSVSLRWNAFNWASLALDVGAEVPFVRRQFALARPERALTESAAVAPSVRLSLEYWRL